MIDVIPAILSILRNDATFMGLVQNNLFHEKSEQAPGPSTPLQPDAIVYGISTAFTEGLAGTSPPWIQRVTVDCRGRRSTETKAIAQRVYDLLENFRGTVGESLIQGCFPVSDVASSDDTSAVKSRVIDFRVTHSPA